MNNNIEQLDIAVIGAGLTGLTTAHYLSKSDKKIVIFEKQDRCGGVINTATQNGFTYEEGPNTGIVGTPEVADLFEELKDLCELEIANDEVDKRYILKNSKWEALPSGLFAGIKTPLFSLKDKFRLLGEPFRSKGTNPHESLADLVKRRLGQSLLDYAIDPFILGVYSGDPSILVPKYALPKLYNLEQDYGSFIGGAVKKKFEKKDEEAKKATRKVFSTKGGLSSLTNALYKSIGENNFYFNSNQLVIKPENGKYNISVSINGKTKEFIANNVITTTGAFALPEMLPFIDENELKKLTSLYYARVIEVILGFENWNGFPLDGFGGLIPHKEKRDILGVLFLSTLLKNRAPKNGALLTLFIGGVRRDELVDLSDEEVRELVEKEVKELMQIDEFNPELFKIIRHNKAIPQYGVDSGERFEAINQLQSKYPGLILGGNMRNGIGMADRITQGKQMANSVINK
ncbi:MAG: protoporphyrinogen oxidase [Bacteroidales bacterium]|jgi:oxygen-dependent protoporphyrinogen oxidase|nr:protoporphyrinogen oxidase [Bacteroidales bacterium]